MNVTKYHDFPEMGMSVTADTHSGGQSVAQEDAYDVIPAPGGCHCDFFSLVVGKDPLCIPYVDYGFRLKQPTR